MVWTTATPNGRLATCPVVASEYLTHNGGISMLALTVTLIRNNNTKEFANYRFAICTVKLEHTIAQAATVLYLQRTYVARLKLRWDQENAMVWTTATPNGRLAKCPVVAS